MASDVYRETLAESIADRIELNNLVMVHHKQDYLARDQARLTAETNRIQAGLNGMATATQPAAPSALTASDTAASSTSTEDAAGGIVNRSPTTINHYYPQAPTTTPPVTPPKPPPSAPSKGVSPWWLLAIPLALGLGGLTYVLWPKTPAPPQTPPGYTVGTTIKLGDAP